MSAKLAILAIFCQFRQISWSIGIDAPWVNTGEFGDFRKSSTIDNVRKISDFGNLLPILSN